MPPIDGQITEGQNTAPIEEGSTQEGAIQETEPTEDFDLDFTGDKGDETSGQNLNPTEPSPEATPEANPTPTPEPTPGDDIESLRQQLAAANLRLLQYEEGKVQQSQPQAQPQPAPQQTATPSPSFPQTANEVSDLDFIGQADHLSILENRDSFNALLNKVATVAYNAAVMASQERILRQIPKVVETTANQQLQIKDIVGRFYATNKDLEPYKPAVSMAAIKLHNENPNMPLEEMLTKAAEETRRVLRIRPGVQNRQRVPAQPVGGGRVGGDRTQRSQTLSDQEQQILDLLS